MKEYEFEMLAKKTLVKVIPGCLNELEEQGLSNISEISTEQLISIAGISAGISSSYAITFAKELIKEVLLQKNIIEKE
ncbi:hypothetical protein [Desulfoscipio geothermicus]|uniref:Uncharacterized protein n=1 Tax=Desulfoscipio geothermicus DSM 3669 TaxID=1121426 RepID=A0A1I6CQQ0_9FIRM|nr:hypothetical protein [Desulfoscipio geothermicus]SFQ95468.1 hypothetical protein SAMN05660706_101199 [Desulfoscipio geothermicus DSM 3669]